MDTGRGPTHALDDRVRLLFGDSPCGIVEPGELGQTILERADRRRDDVLGVRLGALGEGVLNVEAADLTSASACPTADSIAHQKAGIVDERRQTRR